MTLYSSLITDMRKAIAATVKQEGILSLWRGWGPTILRDVPFSCKFREIRLSGQQVNSYGPVLMWRVMLLLGFELQE